MCGTCRLALDRGNPSKTTILPPRVPLLNPRRPPRAHMFIPLPQLIRIPRHRLLRHWHLLPPSSKGNSAAATTYPWGITAPPTRPTATPAPSHPATSAATPRTAQARPAFLPHSHLPPRPGHQARRRLGRRREACVLMPLRSAMPGAPRCRHTRARTYLNGLLLP